MAQTPAITKVSPLSGPIGTVVSITGNNFDANPSNNVVFLGAAKANILTASNTLLTVSAPSGSTYQPISVTVNGLTAYSQYPFDVTFTGPPFNSSSLVNKVDISSDSFVYGVAVKDLDGDGKTDMVVVNSGSATISIFKNNSQLGTATFTLAATKSMDNYSVGVAIDDLNGDTKPDIVVTNFNANTISVFTNTSTVNQLSFANAITFSAGNNPYNVAIADFNGDGKPDVAVTNESGLPSTIAVFTNSTLPSGAISFLPVKYFPTQSSPRGITVSDIDLDGKPDIAVACQSGFVSLLKNTSTINNINFAAKVDLSCQSNSTESVVIADFDGDQKPDIAAANNNISGTISIFKNNGSVTGVFAFSPRQDFATGTNPFSIAAGDINGDGKPDIAISNQVTNSVSVLINQSTPGAVTFYNKIDFATGGQPRSAFIADVDGNGKPDIIIGNNGENTVSILLANSQKIQSVITFQQPVNINIDANNILHPVITSNNNETPITYTSSNPAVAYVGADGAIHVVAPGTVIITANQSGNTNYIAATPMSQTFIIKQFQAITLPAIAQKVACDNDFSINATSNNTTLPINYISSNPGVATISAIGLIHIISAGTTTITASQPGNNLFIDAAPQSQSLTVIQPSSPVVTITADKSSACIGAPVTFTAAIANASANITYQWTVNGSAVGTNNAKFILSTLLSTDVIQCKIINNDACAVTGLSNTLTIPVQALVTPSVSITSSATVPVCPNTAVTLTAVTTNAGLNITYQWLVNGTTTATTTVPSYTSTNFLNGDEITCIISNIVTPCSTFQTVTSNKIVMQVINPVTPVVTVKSSANNVYSGTLLTFTALCQVPVTLYQWKVNNASAGANTSTFSISSLKNGDKVSCLITTTAICTVPVASQALTINVLQPPTIQISNTFTPNGDGVNDVWEIPDLSFYSDCLIKIYDRSGRMVYQSKGYATPWNGRFNGKELPVGIYYYVIDINTSKALSGYVSIIR